jgi:radical SAM superfamily enzyme YgiQ (UPF0313 family)
MNVLLTTSAAPTQSPFSTTEKRPPLGLGFLIAVLRDAGHKVFFIDNYLSPSNFLETDYLWRHHIDFVGIYANTICFRDTRRMLHKLEFLRQTGRWQGKIIVGGPHTSVALETIPAFVDFVVQGEGERAILDIVEGRAAERVLRCRRIDNLDDLPMPAWDYLIDQPYIGGGDWFPGTPVFTMNTSRGCPFPCTFCSVGSIWGRKYTSTGISIGTIPRSTRAGNSRWLPRPVCSSTPRCSSRWGSMTRASSKMWICACGWGN